MKGGHIYSFKGRLIFLALVTLVLFTTLMWTWERNPIIAMTLRSAQEWYHLPSGLYSSQEVLNDINHLCLLDAWYRFPEFETIYAVS